MTRPAVLMTGPYPDWDMLELERRFDVLRLWEAADRAVFLSEHGHSVRAIATRGELGATRELMSALPTLEIVACYGVGVDAIDLAFARERGVRVTNTPDVLSEDVADLGIGLLIAAARHMPQADAYVREGLWAKANMEIATRVWGKPVGILGLGRIGTSVARRLAGFTDQIGYWARSPRPEAPWRRFDTPVALASWADFLIVTVAGGEATRNLVDASVLDALGPDGIFVNISRGSTVDEEALIVALQTGRIRAAGLDVFRNEPNIDPRFATLPNVVLQPHHGSGTVETRKAMGALVRANLEAHFAGSALITPVA